jgi:hypothetical protein
MLESLLLPSYSPEDPLTGSVILSADIRPRNRAGKVSMTCICGCTIDSLITKHCASSEVAASDSVVPLKNDIN